MIRAASLQPSNGHEAFCQFSDLKPLRDAPLEIRLKGIREIPSLINAMFIRHYRTLTDLEQLAKLLDSRGVVMPWGGPTTPDGLETCQAPQTR